MSNLYLLAIMPPEELSARIRAIQEEFAERYDCKAGLKNRVHLTLIPPFRASEEEEKKFLRETGVWCGRQPALPVVLSGFSSFKRNQVIFIDLEKNDKLTAFQKSLEDLMVWAFPQKDLRSHRSYNPHFTIGYKDIPKHIFRDAEQEYLSREFKASFVMDSIYLWKHNGKTWDVIQQFELGQNSGG